MPQITLVAVPRPGATAHLDDTEFYLGVPTQVDDPDALGRLDSLKNLGYSFVESEPVAPAPDSAGELDPADVQAPASPTPQES